MTERPVDPRVVALAARWVNDSIAQDEVDLFERADFFIVETHDLELDDKTFHGPFISVEKAAAWAITNENDVNRALEPGESPWVCTVRPVWHPGRDRGQR